MKPPVLAVLALAAAVAAGCQTAGDQLIELPPSETDIDASGTADDAGVSGDSAEPTVAEEGTSCEVEGLELGSMSDLHPSVDGYEEGVVRITDAAGTCEGSIDLPVRIAQTQDERAHGLMEVPELPDGVGMWFTGYTEDRTGGFYMKDTLVPLDIAYVAADGTIVDILAMEPCTADPCPTYPPDEPYRTTLEVAQGVFADSGVAEGDRIELVARESEG